MKTNIIEVKKEEEKKFENFYDLHDKLTNVEESSEWEQCTAEEIYFSETEGANPFEGFGGDEFSAVSFSRNYGITSIPLRYTALGSILQRAECFGNGIKRLFLADKAKFAAHLNDYISLKEKDKRQSKMLALIQDGKLSALHSGTYTPIKMSSVFELVDDFVNEFEKCSFLGGKWSWENCQAEYRINDTKLDKVYTSLIGKYITFKTIHIELLALSSDVAEAAVRFYPRFILDGHYVPLTCGAAVKHVGKVSIDTVEERLGDVFKSFEASCRSLAALGDIFLNNKKNVMIKAFSKLNIPQKYAAEVANKYSNSPTTALDVYTSMCAVLGELKSSKLSDTTVLNYEEQLSKLITYNRNAWLRFDVPGEVYWNAKRD